MSKVSAIQLNSGPNVKVNLYDVKTFIEQIADLRIKDGCPSREFCSNA
jgi:hypothetical protein